MTTTLKSTNAACLHIGTHKTGTTSIQEFLKQNKEFLGRHNIASVVDDGILINSDKQRAAHRIADVLVLGSRAKKWSQLKEYIISLQSKPPIILSSERFFRYYSAAKSEEDQSFISSNIKAIMGQNVRFILYVRNISEYYNSLVSERIIATSECRPIRDIVNAMYHLAEIQSVVEHLEAEFGKQSVDVYSFDTAVKEPGGLLAHFARGVGWGHRDDIQYSQDRLHSMPPAHFLALKYRMNSLDLTKKIYRLSRRQIARVATKHRESRSFRIIDDDVIDSTIDIARQLNQLLSSRIGVSEDVLFSPKVKNKDYVDISRFDPNQMLYALLELYQVSSLADIKNLKVFEAKNVPEMTGA